MRLGVAGGVAIVIIAVAAIIGYSAMFSVYETRQALVLRFGEPREVIKEAGLHFKLPFIDNVVFVDKRILDLENPAQEVIASDQKRIVVDAFARYRIEDPLRFYQSLGSIAGANSQLSILLNSALRRVLGESSFQALVRDDRSALMGRIREQLDREAERYGINVVDVRIRRADLPPQNSDAIYRRMQQERVQEAAQYRAQGEQASQEIRSKADRDATVILAEAQRQSEIARGEGDAEKNRIFAEAFSRDPDFFAFYRSMNAYQASLKGDNTTVILSPDSEFFRYFGDETPVRR